MITHLQFMSRQLVTTTLVATAILAATPTLPVRAQGGPAPVEVVPLVRRKVASGQVFLGTVKATRRSTIGSAVAGRVSQMLVEEGDFVVFDEEKALGQDLAQLRTKSISIQVAAAKAEEELRMHEWEELEKGSRPEEIRQAEARRDATEALWKYAAQRFERVKSLNERKGVSDQELDEAQSAKLAAEKSHVAAQAGFELVKNGPRAEKIAQAKARLSIAQEEVKRLEDMQAKYTIRTPFTGYVAVKHTEVGNWLSQGDPVLEVLELDPIEIELAIPEQHISHMFVGMEAQFRVAALPGRVFDGKVSRIVPDANPRSRTFPVRVRLANPRDPQRGHLLKTGMLCRVTLAVGEESEVLLAPKDALVLNRDDIALMIVARDPEQPDATFARRVGVSLGVVTGALIQVRDPTETLEEGVQVIVKGNERLRPNQRIQILPSASAPR